MAGDRPVTATECKVNVDRIIEKIDAVQEDVDEIKIILKGSDRRSGLVKDVNYLITQSRMTVYITGVIIGIIASVVGTIVTHWLIG